LDKYDFIVFSVALVNVIVTPSFNGENQMYNSDPGSSYTHVIRIPKNSANNVNIVLLFYITECPINEPTNKYLTAEIQKV
jgi:hypothetical protein